MSERRPLIDSDVATLLIWILGACLFIGIICQAFCFYKKQNTEQYMALIQAIAHAQNPEERAAFSREIEILDIDKATSDIPEEAILLDNVTKAK